MVRTCCTSKKGSGRVVVEQDEVRDTCGDSCDAKACEHGVEHLNCRRKRNRTSKSVSSDYDVAHLKLQNVGPEEAKSNSQSSPFKHSEQVHPNRSGARVNYKEKPVEKGKTKYLSTDEVKNMLSEGRKGEPPHVDLVSSKPKHDPSNYNKKFHPSRSGNTQKNTSVQKVKELKSISTPEKKYCQMRQTLKESGETASASHMSRRGQTCDILGELKHSDVDNVIFNVTEFIINVAVEESLPTDPSPIASWIGSFKLEDEKTCISFHAHPTSKGLSKVREFSRKMPQVLEFQLCLYDDVLRTSFKGCDPDDKDIGLYFFPYNGNSLNEYISQLEKLSRKYFLRSCIDGVELLVFTSKVLHKDYRKRNKSDFLWGIYRHRHKKCTDEVEETMVAEMST